MGEQAAARTAIRGEQRGRNSSKASAASVASSGGGGAVAVAQTASASRQGEATARVVQYAEQYVE